MPLCTKFMQKIGGLIT